MADEQDYLMLRGDSRKWQLQLIVPDDVRQIYPHLPAKLVQSMRTADREEARKRSAPIIAEFKDLVSQAKWTLHGAKALPRVTVLRLQEPDTVVTNDDGTISVAAKDTITVIVPSPPYRVVRSYPNTIQSVVDQITIPHVDGGQLTINREFGLGAGKISKTLAPPVVVPRDVPADTDYSFDLSVLAVWRDSGDGVNARYYNEARKTLDLFHSVTGKTLVDAVYEDGQALDRALIGLGNSTATRKKKIGWLGTSYKLAKRQTRTFPQLVGRDNPFSGVVSIRKDALRKEDFTDEHTDLFRERMHELGQNERDLLLWCLATGCRRGEPFQIRSEMVADGFRCITFGTKTDASYRRLPMPPALLERYPEPISGPLFGDSEKNIGRNLNRWFRKIGITSEALTLHSTRHRAATLLRLRDDKDSIRWEILGHENRAEQPSEGYGHYPPRPLFEPISSLWPVG